MRLSIAAAIACLSIAGVAAGDRATAAIKTFTNIPAEGLGPALQTLAQAHDLQIVYLSEAIDKLKTSGVVGEFTAEEALKRLLKGTGLTYRYLDEKTITVAPISTGSPISSTGGETRSSASPDVGSQDGSQLWERFRLAQANPGSAQRSSTVGSDVQSSSESSEKSPQLTEILVTAQKKTEREQDVPIAMTVLDPQALAQGGQNRLQDYFASVPGVSISPLGVGGGTTFVSIRGLATDPTQNATTAIVIDDVPVGSSLALVNGNVSQPDLDPSDLTRIEVLKGPQGTLYGADSLGGLIKYVTADPSTNAFSGRAEVTGVDIPDGGGGYAVRAAANVPLSDSVALRVSGFSRHDPGYIDDLTTGQNNVNSVDVYGGHLSLLYRPLETLSIKLGAVIQNADGNGSPYVNSNIFGQFPQGDLKQTEFPGVGPYQTRWQFYTAAVNADVAGVHIVSLTGYNTNSQQYHFDLSGIPFFSSVANSVFPGATGEVNHFHFYSEKVSQEIRLSSSVSHWLDWTAGAFYTHEGDPGTYGQNTAVDTTTGALEGVLVNYGYPIRFNEYAGFGDLTVHVTDRFDLQVGGRQSWDSIHYDPTIVGPGVPNIFTVPSPDLQPPEYAKAAPFTYLVTPKYAISPDLQIYGRIASGYRVGGPNQSTGAGVTASVPLYYKPDKTINYELGIKGDIFDHLLRFDVAAYYIDWRNFQTNVTTDGGIISYTTNAGDAKSEGLELSVESHPATGLTVAVQGSYDNAVLTHDLPPAAVAAGTYGLAGDRLPFSIKLSGGATANQDVRLTKDWVGFVGAAVNYVGSRLGEFAGAPPPYTPANPPRVSMPGYTQLNLRTGARYQSWRINLYANNVTDKRGIIGIFPFAFNLGNSGGSNATVIQPRTIGLSISETF